MTNPYLTALACMTLAAVSAPVVSSSAIGGDDQEHARARIQRALEKYAPRAAEVRAETWVSAAATRAPEKAPEKVPAGLPVRKATRWPDLCATTDAVGRSGRVGHPGPRGDWRASSRDAYVALPSKAFRGRTAWVQCQCAKHGRLSAIVSFPILDIGPWSVGDNFIDEARRPWAERGKSDMYRKVPARAPAIDLSPAAWAALGHHIGYGAAAGNFAGTVDLVVFVIEERTVAPSPRRAANWRGHQRLSTAVIKRGFAGAPCPR